MSRYTYKTNLSYPNNKYPREKDSKSEEKQFARLSEEPEDWCAFLRWVFFLLSKYSNPMTDRAIQ